MAIGQLCIPVNGARAGVLGNISTSHDYMNQINARAKKLAKAYAPQKTNHTKPLSSAKSQHSAQYPTK